MKFSSITLLAVVFIGFSACQSSMTGTKGGQKLFEQGEYELAIKAFEAVKKTDEAKYNYLIAESYRLSNRIEKASDYYQRAAAAGCKEQELPFHLAYSLKAQGKYAEAAASLEKYIKPNVVNRVALDKARREVENLKEIEGIATKKSYFEVRPVEGLNTLGSEFSPIIFQEDVLFTTSRKDRIYTANNLPMLALYKTKITGATATTPVLYSDRIFKGDANEGTPAFSKDGKIMVFSRGNNGSKKNNTYDCDLYMSKWIDGQWAEPMMITAISDSLSWEGCPAFSGDGKTLYFGSNRPGGKGGIDIYRVSVDNSGRFGRPINMGGDLNTSGDEMFPYVSPDAKLYFASDGHAGLGKLDLFVATRSGGEITVENLGPPFNSTGDDFGLVMIDKDHGYLSSNRDGGKGDDDIYYFENTRPNETPEQPVITKKDDYDPNDPNKKDGDKGGNTPKKIIRYALAGNIMQLKLLNTGGVTDEVRMFLEGVSVKILDEDGNTIGESTTDPSGAFGPYPIKENADYTILASKTDYLTKRELFSMIGRSIPQEKLTKAETDTTFNVTVYLDKPQKGQIINKLFTINTIYYDLDKADIRSDASIELDKVVQILQDNPTVSLELGSHTDCRAPDRYNLLLSQRRAEAAVAYMVSRGIEAKRLKAKGYGETQLINGCKDGVNCPEEDHQANRRTEFKVIGVE